jgi:hypothetical protein
VIHVHPSAPTDSFPAICAHESALSSFADCLDFSRHLKPASACYGFGLAVLENSLRHSSEENTRVTFRDRLQRAMVANVNNTSTVYAKQQREPTFAQQLEAMVWALYRERIDVSPTNS